MSSVSQDGMSLRPMPARTVLKYSSLMCSGRTAITSPGLQRYDGMSVFVPLTSEMAVARRSGAPGGANRRSRGDRPRYRGGISRTCSRFSPVDAGAAFGHLEVAAELALQDAVGAPRLLLLAQLQAIIRNFTAPSLAMLAGGLIAPLNRALRREAALPLQEQLHVLRDGTVYKPVRYNGPWFFLLCRHAHE